MKKFLNPEPSGGVPITNELLYTLQSEPFKASLALYASVAPLWVVNGCNITYTLGSTTCSMSGGYVFIDGELREVGEVANSVFPFYIVADTDTYDAEQFGNGAIQNMYVNKKAIITTVRPTNGTFLLVNPLIKDDTITKRIKPLLTNDTSVLLNAEIQARVDGDIQLNNSIVAEANSRINSDNQLQTNINNLSAVVNQKQNRVTVKIPWQDLVLTNQFYTTSDNANDPYRINSYGSIYQKAQIMRDEDGVVHLRGYLRGNGGGILINNLPNDLRPKGVVRFSNTYITSGNNAYPGNVVTVHTIEIDPFGQVVHDQRMNQVVNSSADPGALQLLGFQPWFTLDGFSYSVE